MTKNPLVHVIVLNYNGYQDTVECLDSLERATYDNFRVVLVDNGSTDSSGKRLARRYPQHFMIRNSRNLGFAGGYNAGIRMSLAHGAEYVCILNNDTTVSVGFLDALAEAMGKEKSAGIAGPVVCEHGFPDVIQSAGARADLYAGSFRGLCKGKSRGQVRGIREVDYISGACMLVRSSMVREVGLIPEEYFLFFEETEWCFKARRSGHKVICAGDSVIWHKGSRSTGKTAGTIVYYMTRNQIVFEKRNASQFQWATFMTLRMFTFVLGAAKRWVTGEGSKDVLRGIKDGLTYRREDRCPLTG